ncbi:MAG: AAA family ATPase [Proteobacteria bacterium]|nr:AAA family ATPase [Pseudomonadota bacterium]
MALSGILQSLLSPRAYPHPVQEVRLVETHISWLLLTGTLVYKIKRPVHFPFVDLRSAERREFLCHEEVRLNRRFAPGIYLGVSRITADAAGARIDGTGSVLESCVRMRQFDPKQQLDHLLQNGALQPNELFEFGRDLARIHATLPAVDELHDWGQPEAVRAMLLRNFDECTEALGDGVAAALRAQLDTAAKSAAGWLTERRLHARVRECHGDLHCSNIVRLEGKLCAFDGLEFDPAMRWIDVADEIAFLLADLAPYDDPTLQQAFLGGYLLESGDYEACRFLHLYQAHRFLVRAKVIALSREGGSTAAYVEAARRALAAKRPLLILMSGLSGSGKSWLAQRLAPFLGAVHLRSDVERKRLAGMSIGAEAAAAPGEGLYTQQRSEQVQEHLLASADALLAGGYTTIVDATFIRHNQRQSFLALAIRLGVPLRIIRCEASEAILEARIDERARKGTDPSDADLAVLQWQLAHEEPFDSEEAGFVLCLSSEDSRIIDTARRHLEPLLGRTTPFDSISA